MILGWQNDWDTATLAAGSQIGTLPVTNTQNAHLSQKWQTVAGVKSSFATADMGASTVRSLLAVLGTNLTSTTVARLRGSDTDATGQTPVKVDTVNFSPVKTGYPAFYKSLRGRYATTGGLTPTFAVDCTGGSVTTLGSLQITFTRAGATATRVNEKGLVESVAADVPRIDYDPITFACRGWLIEQASTNIQLRSAEFDNAAWVKDGCAVEANVATAPDGTTAMDRVRKAGAGVSWGMLTQAIAAVNPNGKVFSFSVWLQAEAGTVAGVLAISDVNTNTYTQAFVATTTPQRFTFTSSGPFSNVGGALGGGITLNNVGDSVLVWGAQLENTTVPTSYIPTVGASVTRNADLATVAGVEAAIGAAAATVVAEFTPQSVTAAAHVVDAEVADANNRVFDLSTDASIGQWFQNNAGVGQFGFGISASLTVGVANVIAGAYQKNSAAVAANGVITADDLTCAAPAGATTMAIGSLYNAGVNTQFLNGWVRRFSIFPFRATDAQLVVLSSLTQQTLVDFEPKARYWRLELTDNSVASNLQIGRVFLGPSWKHTQSMIYGWGVTPEDASPVTKSRGGQSFPDALPKFRSIDFQLKFLTESEIYSNPFAAARANGVAKDVLVIPMESSSYVPQEAVFGLCQALQPVIHENSQYFSQKFHVEERL